MRNIVNAVLVDGDKVLLARRSTKRKAYPDLWSFPGGHVEQGETLEQALVREAGEEIGIVPVEYAAVSVIADPNALLDTPVQYHMYRVTRWDGEPAILDNEHSELQWFSIVDALQLADLALQEYRPLMEALRRPRPE